MANNTTVDPIDYKNPKIKCLNLIKVKEHILNLYRRYGSLADAINTLIGEGDDTPNIIDNISEAIASSRLLDAVKNDTYTHIHHSNDGTSSGPKETFSATANDVKFNFQCKHLLDSGNYTQHSEAIPVASASQAGIITSEGGAFFDTNTTGKVDTLDTLKDFLDGVENESVEVIYGSKNNVTFTRSMSGIYTSDLTFDFPDNLTKLVKIIIENSSSNINQLLKWKSGYSNDTIWTYNGAGTFSLDSELMSSLNPLYASLYDAYITENDLDKLVIKTSGTPWDSNVVDLILLHPNIKIIDANDQIVPLETRLDEKLGKTVYNTTDANNILKGLVLHSSTDLQVGPLEVTLPFKLDSSILSTELNVNSMLEGVWIIDITGSIYKVVDDDTLVSLVKITDLTTTYSYSSPQFINKNEIKLTLAL